MTALIVVGIVLALLAALLCCRVRILAEYAGEEFHFAVRYLFFTYRMKQRGKGKPKVQAPEAPKRKPAKATLAQVRQFIDLFERFRGEISRVAAKLRKRARIDRLELAVVIAEEDPAETAVAFGGACALLYPAVAALGALLPIRRREVEITPRYGGECSIRFRCTLSIRVGALLGTGLAAAARVAVSLVRNPVKLPGASPKAAS